MKQHSRDTDGRALEIGQKAESDFVIFAKNKGWKVKPATKLQNTREHFDYILSKDGMSLKVDVKAEKRINRSDSETQSDLIWLEYLNGAGETGWLLGEADFIAFQEGDTYLVIPRKKLVDRAAELVSLNKVSSASKALYNLYTRFRRKDLLTMVKRSDIADLHYEL